MPDPDNVIRITSKQRLSVRRPSERQTLRRFRLAGLGDDLRPQFLDHLLALEVPDLDGRPESGAQPVPKEIAKKYRSNTSLFEIYNTDLLGEKHNAVMMSLWSKVCKCLPSLRSHSMAFESLPPLAHKLPSGDTVTVFK